MDEATAARHSRRPRARLVAALLVIAAIVAPASAVAGSKHHPSAPRPTIVLVHGAWADSSSWAGVTYRLQKQGYPVDVVANPLRSLPGDADYLAAYLRTIDGPVVLVGHSYGGAVVTNAAVGLTNVKSLVYVDAFIPEEGETVVGLAGAMPGSALAVADPSTVFKLVPYPGGAPGDYDAYILPSVFPQAFANDLPARTAAVLASTQRPVTLSALGTPSGPAAWHSIPSWAVVGTQDHVLPPAEQLAMARRAGSHITTIAASHLSMISQPKAVAAVITDAAR